MAVVEPYFAGSHQQWAEGLATFSRHDVHLITHAGGFWKWRMHGGAVTLARALADASRPVGGFNVLVVSDMVNLAALLGVARRSIPPATPVVLYMHENQLTYPTPEGVARDETYGITNWVSMCAADHVVFNSSFHRDDVFAALPALLRRFPDHRHGHLVEEVFAKTSVLPVGVDPALVAMQRPSLEGAPTILWNHRWEYDKNPRAFFDLLDAVDAAGVDFALAVAGQQFQTVPEVFDAARRRFASRLVHFGTAPRDEYVALLGRSDIVVSTADHDFFGLAVLEAIAAGAAPLLPRRLAYPELVAVDAHEWSLYDDPAHAFELLLRLLTDEDHRGAVAHTCRTGATPFAWPSLIERYDAFFESVALASADG